MMSAAAQAVRAAQATVARLLGLDGEIGQLSAGTRTDMSLFDNDFNVLATVQGGEWHEQR